MLKLYGYKKCGTCRKAEKALTEAGVAYEYIDITENAPSKKYLREVIKHSGLDIKKAFNTSGVQYRELKMKDKIKGMSESEMIDLLSTQGKLCKRPMLLDAERGSIGFKEGEFQAKWCQ
jgi:arsenate reductase (glutaredoxin)